MKRLALALKENRGFLLILTIAIIASLALSMAPVQTPKLFRDVFRIGMDGVAYGVTLDAICDGDNDDVQVQAILTDNVPATGGEIILLAGAYDFHATVFRHIDNVKISGSGAATIITTDDAGEAPFNCETDTGWTFEAFACDDTPLYDTTGGMSSSTVINGIWIAGVYTVDLPTEDTTTMLDAYGAGAYPYVATVGPVGGGFGYVDILDPDLAEYTCDNKANFLSAAAAATTGEHIYIPNGTTIDMTNQEDVAIAAGVTLFSTRGSGTDNGGILYVSTVTAAATYPQFLLPGAGVRITGLQLQGPDQTLWETAGDSKQYWAGIWVSGSDNVKIDNCVIFGWDNAGIVFTDTSTGNTVTHCNIHHNCRMGLGYGVQVSHQDEATITACTFDYNRHCITGVAGDAADPAGTKYYAYYNEFGANCLVAQAVDLHGGNDTSEANRNAGDVIIVAYCTFKTVTFATGTTPTISYVPTPVSIRGIPQTNANFHHNWFYWEGNIETYLIYQSCQNIGYTRPNLWLTGSAAVVAAAHVTASNNWIGTDPFPGGGSGGDMPRFEVFTELTLASGAVEITSGYRNFTITSESGATDTLVTITGGETGQLIVIMPTAGDDITVDHNAGNIWVSVTEADIVLDADDDCLMLVYNGSKWATIR